MEDGKSPPVRLFGSGARYFSESDPDIFETMLEKAGYREELAAEMEKTKERNGQMRYAAYIRISSEDQVGNFSLDAQLRAIQTWVTAQGGILVNTYTDEAQSGKSANRPGFQ